MMAGAQIRLLAAATAFLTATAGCTARPATSAPVALDTDGSEVGWWTTQIRIDGALAPLGPELLATARPGTDAIIVIAADVFFEHDSSILMPDEASALDEVAALITANDEPVAIVGHTDDTGTTAYNNQLGLNRAVSIQRQLHLLGVPDHLMVDVESRGETCPVATNSTVEGRSQNRRVEIHQPGQPTCPEPSQP